MANSGAIRAGLAFVELFVDDSKLVRGLRRAEAKLKAFGNQIRNIGMGMAQLGAAAAAPLIASTKVFVGFDDQMRSVQAVLGASGEQFDRLNEKAKLLGRTTSYTAAQVAGAMLELARAGFNTDEIDKATGDMLALARATGTDLAEATNIAGNALRSFGMGADEMGRVADVMTATANNSAQTLTDLGEALKDSSPIAKEYGLTIEQTSKALGALANFGIKGSKAGTTMKNIMLQLANPSIRKQIKDLGVEVTDVGKFRDVGSVLTGLGAAIKNMPTPDKLALMDKLFGKRAIAGGIKLTTANFEKLNDAIDNANGTAKKTAATMDSGIGGVMRRLWSAIEGVAIAIGDSLAKELSRTGEKITEFAGRATDWVKKNGALIISLAKTAAKLIVVGAALAALGKTVAIIGGVVGAIRGLVSAIRAVGAAMLFLVSNPVALLAAGIAAVVAVFVDWGSILDGIKSKLGFVAAGVSDLADAHRQETSSLNAEHAALKSKAQRLEELQKKQNITNVEMLEAKTLAAELSQIYPTLAGHLRTLGKEAKQTAEFYERMDRAQAKQLKQKLQKQLHSARYETTLIEKRIKKGEKAKALLGRDQGEKNLKDYFYRKYYDEEAAFLKINKRFGLERENLIRQARGHAARLAREEVDRMKAYAQEYDANIKQLAKAKDEINRLESILFGKEPTAPKKNSNQAGIVSRTDVKAMEKIQSETDRWQRETHRQKLRAIENEHRREMALIHDRYEEEIKNARKLGETPDETRGLVEAIHKAKTAEQNRARDEYNRKIKEQKANVDNARSSDIKELELRSKYKGIELEKKLLKLEESRAIIAARSSGASLIMIAKEFALKRKILEADAADALKQQMEVRGTFNAAALQGLQGAGSVEKQIAAATEQTKKDIRKLTKFVVDQRGVTQEWG